MSQTLVLTLLVLALVVPFVGATILRLLAGRIASRTLIISATLVFSLAIGSAIALARAPVTSLTIAGFTVLLPYSAPARVPLPPQPPTQVPTATAPRAAETAVPATAAPTARPTMTPTPPPTIAPVVPTALPTATPEVSPTPTVAPEATAAPTVAPTAAPATGETRRYVVQEGDTLGGIATSNGTTVALLLAANNLTPEQAELIRPGQELILP
jgi:LysM repeat protein